ncbi:spore protease YyaC [Pelotomaculum terephthalicicum JT]|uniref:spore protease YyaC n=1 Tax=Pelotomaculum terephthalicicum TaxID=206393 RepID=UPI001F033F46|nr:spore protease YyaC [Pelotomaculum terephthalicicum]MCG9966859.1 spore protease YyaC [Pelotomaculum terephthalicicum JT]
MKNIGQLNTITNIEKTCINIEDTAAVNKFATDLAIRLKRFAVRPESPKVLLCIGTDRSTGDCLGPLVGSIIDSGDQDFYIVYGTLEKPIHASNLRETIEEIQKNYQDPFVIAIDASLGKLENVGYVNLGDGSLLPGAGVNKNLPPVGQIHITGIVNIGGFMEYLVLQNTRLNLVMRIADVIANGLKRAIPEYKKINAWGL